jgi:cytochrome b561
MAMTAANLTRYDATTIMLHWFVAVSVIVLWVIGQTADFLPHGALNAGYWSIHVALGFVLVVALIWRIVWRVAGGLRLPAAESGVLGVIAKATHFLLYALLIVVLTLGVANAFVRGYHIFGLVSLPEIGDRAWRRPITGIHGLVANILLAVAFLHALAALAHHYVMRDGVLRRMMPARAAT